MQGLDKHILDNWARHPDHWDDEPIICKGCKQIFEVKEIEQDDLCYDCYLEREENENTI